MSLPLLMRYRLRALVRHPWRTSARVTLITLAIGPTVALSSLGIRIYTSPLPFAEPSTLVALGTSYEGSMPTAGLTFGDFAHIESEVPHVLTAVAAFQSARYIARADQFDFYTGEYALRLAGARVSPSFFGVVGTAPLLGRVFTPASYGEGDSSSTVISDRLWRGTFGHSPDIIDTKIRLGGATYTIIGVMPASFQGVDSDPTDIWIPWVPSPTEKKVPSIVCCTAVARRNRTIPLGDANRLLSEGMKQRKLTAVPIRERLASGAFSSMRLLAFTIALVLVLTVITLVHGNLTTVFAGNTELVLLRSYGASGNALWLLIALEEAIVTAIAIPPSVTISMVIMRSLGAMMLPEGPLPLIKAVTLTSMAGVLVGIVTSGIAGLVAVRRVATSNALSLAYWSRVTHHTSRWRRAATLAVAAALTVILVISSFATVSALRLNHLTLGFDPSHVIVVGTRLAFSRYKTPDDVARFERLAIEKLKTVPGVTNVTYGSYVPILVPGRTRVTKDAEGFRIELDEYRVHAQFFDTLDIPILEGRRFQEFEPEPVAIISRRCARRFGDVRTGNGMVGLTKKTRIIGVADDIVNRVSNFDRCSIFVPPNHEKTWSVNFLMHVQRFDDRFAHSARLAIHDVDPSQPVDSVTDFDAKVTDALTPRYMFGAVVGSLMLLTWAVGLVWFYSVIIGALAERRVEIGVRLAMGGGPLNVGFGFLWSELRSLIIGAAVGVVLTLPASRLTEHLVGKLEAADLGWAATNAFVGLGAIGLVCALAVFAVVRREPQTLLRS